MKTSLTNKEIETLEKFIENKLEHTSLTTEQWQQFEKIRQRTLKRIMQRLGILGLLVYYAGLIKTFIINTLIKITSAKLVFFVATGTVLTSVSAVIIVRNYDTWFSDVEPVINRVFEKVEKNKYKDNTEKSTNLEKPNRKLPVYKPNVGIIQFKATKENSLIAQTITRYVMRNLPPEKFKFIQKAQDGGGHINVLVTGSITRTGDTYTVIVTATNLASEYVFHETYRLTDKVQVKNVSKKIARGLQRAGL